MISFKPLSILCPAFLFIAIGHNAIAGVYLRGHGDIGVALEGTALRLHYHLGPNAIVDGSPVGNAPDGREFEPNEQITFVPDPSIVRPLGSQWDFMGTTAGQPIWILPQTEDSNKPFLGFATEELVPADWSAITFSLTAITGPAGAQFSLFSVDALGNPNVRMASSDGISATDNFQIAPGSHGHFNLAFTQTGIYNLTLNATGIHRTLGFRQDTGTFTFAVSAVPEPSSMLLLGASSLAVAFRRRIRFGRLG